MREERRHEVVALGSELQHVSVRNDFGDLGHPIDGVCRALLSVCLVHRKDLALITIAGPFGVAQCGRFRTAFVI